MNKVFTILFVITKALGNKKKWKNKENEIPIRKRLKKNRKNKRNKAVVIIIKKKDENWISHTQQGAK